MIAGVAALSVGAGVAAAADQLPSAVSVSGRGSVTVNSGVTLAPTNVDMRGAWVDTKLPCSTTRQLLVEARIMFGSRTVTRKGTFATQNCGTGFPSRGFTLRARGVGLGCPNGRWKAGEYSFWTDVTERKSGFSTRATLTWTSPGC